MSHSLSLKSLTSRRLIRIPLSMSMADAYDLLFRNKIRHLPVVDENDHIVGIISEPDFVRLGSNNRISPDLQRSRETPVSEVMTRELHVVSIDGDVKEAVDLMLTEKISACLVEKDQEIVGIVTTEDLLILLRTYLNNPSGSLRNKLEDFVYNSPLGTIGHVLSNAGI